MVDDSSGGQMMSLGMLAYCRYPLILTIGVSKAGADMVKPAGQKVVSMLPYLILLSRLVQ